MSGCASHGSGGLAKFFFQPACGSPRRRSRRADIITFGGVVTTYQEEARRCPITVQVSRHARGQAHGRRCRELRRVGRKNKTFYFSNSWVSYKIWWLLHRLAAPGLFFLTLSAVMHSAVSIIQISLPPPLIRQKKFFLLSFRTGEGFLEWIFSLFLSSSLALSLAHGALFSSACSAFALFSFFPFRLLQTGSGLDELALICPFGSFNFSPLRSGPQSNRPHAKSYPIRTFVTVA